VAVGQATPDSSVIAEPGPGADGLVSVQDRPDQVRISPPAELAVPTATHSLVVGHATELRLVPLASAAAGSPAAAQDVPPLSSRARESSSVPWYWYSPTATHFAADGQAIDRSRTGEPPPAPAGSVNRVGTQFRALAAAGAVTAAAVSAAAVAVLAVAVLAVAVLAVTADAGCASARPAVNAAAAVSAVSAAPLIRTGPGRLAAPSLMIRSMPRLVTLRSELWL